MSNASVRHSTLADASTLSFVAIKLIDTSAARGQTIAAQIDRLLADGVDAIPCVIVLTTSMWVALCAHRSERLVAHRDVPIYIAGVLSEPRLVPMDALVSAAYAAESHELSYRWNQSQWDASL
jgi:hypothetical protein